MSPSTEHGCAQDADGNLLSPSKIKWFNDVDDETPIPGCDAAPDANQLQVSSSKSTMITRFFTSVNTSLADNAGGARRSNRATRPSTKVIDPDNIESPAVLSSGMKRKASSAHQQRRTLQKLQDSEDEATSETGSIFRDEGDTEPCTDVEMTEMTSSIISVDSAEEDAEARYASTKALGDSDRKVSIMYYNIFCQGIIILLGSLIVAPKRTGHLISARFLWRKRVILTQTPERLKRVIYVGFASTSLLYFEYFHLI